MKTNNYLILFFIFLLSVTSGFTQILNQDKEGRTSIFYMGKAIHFDLGAPTAAFTYNNLSKRLIKNKGAAFEINVQAKNEEGTANLIRTGDLVPSGILIGRFGLYKDNESNARQNIVFAEVDLRTTRYYLFNADSSKPVDKWLKKNDFFYRRIALNYNYETDRWLFGISAGYQYSNNANTLSPGDYKFEEEYKINNQSINKSYSRSAFKNNEFIPYHSAVVNGDIIHFSNLNDSTNLVWNILYVRTELFCTKSLSNLYNIGSGLYFVNAKGKFMGGMYVQWDDLTNKRNTEAHIAGNLSVGIITRFSFQKIL